MSRQCSGVRSLRAVVLRNLIFFFFFSPYIFEQVFKNAFMRHSIPTLIQYLHYTAANDVTESDDCEYCDIFIVDRRRARMISPLSRIPFIHTGGGGVIIPIVAETETDILCVLLLRSSHQHHPLLPDHHPYEPRTCAHVDSHVRVYRVILSTRLYSVNSIYGRPARNRSWQLKWTYHYFCEQRIPRT